MKAQLIKIKENITYELSGIDWYGERYTNSYVINSGIYMLREYRNSDYFHVSALSSNNRSYNLNTNLFNTYLKDKYEVIDEFDFDNLSLSSTGCCGFYVVNSNIYISQSGLGLFLKYNGLINYAYVLFTTTNYKLFKETCNSLKDNIEILPRERDSKNNIVYSIIINKNNIASILFDVNKI